MATQVKMTPLAELVCLLADAVLKLDQRESSLTCEDYRRISELREQLKTPPPGNCILCDEPRHRPESGFCEMHAKQQMELLKNNGVDFATENKRAYGQIGPKPCCVIFGCYEAVMDTGIQMCRAHLIEAAKHYAALPA